MLAMSDMSAYHQLTPEQKKRRFRELARRDRIQTGRQLVSEREQPFLPLFNNIVTDVEKCSARPKKGVFRGNRQNPTRQDARRRVLMEGPLMTTFPEMPRGAAGVAAWREAAWSVRRAQP
jgi:hypothetical protein